MTEPSLQELEQQRAELFARLAATGDLRPGSINVTYRRCGKPNCAARSRVIPATGRGGSGPGRPGAGARPPLSSGELDEVRAELAAYREFAALSGQIVAVSEAICEARPVPAGGQAPDQEGQKRGSSISSPPGSRRRRPPR